VKPPRIWVRKRWRLTNPANEPNENTFRKKDRISGPVLFRAVVWIVKKFRLGRLGRRTLFLIVAAAAMALIAATLLPYRQYRDQGTSIQQAKQELLELEQRRSDLESRLERAGDKKVIEREARKQMSLVRPGDELFRVVVPSDVIDLPKAWYLPGVEYLVTGQLK